jgi:hypothetical protein
MCSTMPFLYASKNRVRKSVCFQGIQKVKPKVTYKDTESKRTVYLPLITAMINCSFIFP